MNPVNEFLEALDHPLKPLIEEVRAAILATDPRLTEHIKWNAPSFALGDDDRVTMKLFPPKNIQVVFHRGVAKKEQPPERLLKEDFGLLKWAANDRAVATFTSLEDFAAKRADFERVVVAWLSV